jgi:leucyl aminopeptidase (aminopeptidase T)
METSDQKFARLMVDYSTHVKPGDRVAITTSTGALHWMSTIYPIQAYAMETELGFEEFRDFFFSACHIDDATPDPVAHWQQVKKD